ncbi:MAG: site-specific integrase [Pseudomonadota bacterium]|nr:site-specific integrase [Pseudomonadota bacterium]
MATITKLTSGKWRVQVRRKGFYRAGTFTRKRDAQDWATEIEAQISHVGAGGYARPRGATLADLIKLYREQVSIRGRTKDACLGRLSARLGTVKLESLSPVHLRDFIDRRAGEGAGGVTIAQDMSFLATVLDWGRHVRQIDIDPELARDARRSLKHRKMSTRGRHRDRIPTEAELDRLTTFWADNRRQQIPMGVIVRFAAASAMRLGEICRIQAEDVDQQRRTVIIRDRKDPRHKEGNDQVVPLLPDAWDIVQRRVQEHPTGRLFPYSADSVSTAFTRACKRLGIKDLHFHDLRHYGTVLLFRQGLDIPRVAMITGHKSWENLKRYSNLQPEDVHEKASA